MPMTMRDRERLRKLQDRLLATAGARRFEELWGANKPVWEGGPTLEALRLFVWSEWEAKVKQLLNDEEAKEKRKGR